jgi:hypothetical protein
MTAGQVSDYAGAAALLDNLSKEQWLLGDLGYDAVGSETLCRPKASSPTSGVADPATSRSGTTTAATGAAGHRDHVQPPQARPELVEVG